jgi:predicted ArsR family transcriptional regulator
LRYNGRKAGHCPNPKHSFNVQGFGGGGILDNQDTSTRRKILTMLKLRGKLSVADIAKELEITEMAIRRHINTLERDGLIAPQLVRQAMGRPANLYGLTELSDDLFPKKYHHLTLELLGELEEVDGSERVDKLFQGRQARLYDKYSRRMEGKSLEEKVDELADIQNTNGYMVHWDRDDDGNYVLQEHNCPIFQVANQYQQACQCELALFRSLLQTEVQRTECLAKGGEKCVYVIRKAEKA